MTKTPGTLGEFHFLRTLVDGEWVDFEQRPVQSPSSTRALTLVYDNLSDHVFQPALEGSVGIEWSC